MILLITFSLALIVGYSYKKIFNTQSSLFTNTVISFLGVVFALILSPHLQFDALFFILFSLLVAFLFLWISDLIKKNYNGDSPISNAPLYLKNNFLMVQFIIPTIVAVVSGLILYIITGDIVTSGCGGGVFSLITIINSNAN